MSVSTDQVPVSACSLRLDGSPSAKAERSHRTVRAQQLASDQRAHVELGGSAMDYAIFGEGPVRIVGLHGWGGDKSSLQAIAYALPPDCAMLALDLPGYGGSERPSKWSIRSVAELIVERIEPHFEPDGGGTFVLVGGCSGALIALEVSRLMRDRVERLVLVEPFAFMPWYLGLFTLPLLGPFFFWCSFANPIGRLLVDSGLGAGGNDAQRGRVDGFRSASTLTLVRYLRLLGRMDKAESFGDLTLPIDIVYGEDSFSAMHRSVARWRRVWPHAHVWRADCGHMVFQDCPDVVAALVANESKNGSTSAAIRSRS